MLFDLKFFQLLQGNIQSPLWFILDLLFKYNLLLLLLNYTSPNDLYVSNDAGTQCGSLMEVCKAVFSQGSNACDRVAIKADGMSYSYAQLTSSALTISQLFHNENVW